MTVFKSAYETKACQGVMLNKVVDGIKESMIKGGSSALAVTGTEFQPVNDILGIDSNPKNVNIPAFLHPISIKKSHSDHEGVFYVDVRSATRFDPNQSVSNIINSYEYNFIALRGYLQRLWEYGDEALAEKNRELLLGASKNPLILYARWISENISRRFGLDPQTQLTIMVLAAYFYICLFYKDEDFQPHDKSRMAAFISRSLNVSASVVIEIIEPLKAITGVDDFIATMKDVTQNVRLTEINAGLLFGIVGGGWFGMNAREMMNVALEHPPTWIAIVMAAYNDRTYKNSGIGKLAGRDNKEQIKQFTQAIFSLIRFNT